MKSQHIIKYSFLSMIVITVLSCFNGSMVDSTTDTHKRPDVNFYGMIEDHHKTFAAEDILIGGKYEVIPVYQPVVKKIQQSSDEKTKHIDPKQNKALLDLKEIISIELKHLEHPTASQVSINNRDYVEIIVTSINNTKKNYLIESSRKVTCKEIDKGPQGSHKELLEERELNMIHLKKLIIDGYKSVREEPVKRSYDAHGQTTTRVQSESKQEVANNTGKIIDQIEKNVQQLSHESPSTLEAMKSSLLSMLKALREQLQKMLNMLQ